MILFTTVVANLEEVNKPSFHKTKDILNTEMHPNLIFKQKHVKKKLNINLFHIQITLNLMLENPKLAKTDLRMIKTIPKNILLLLFHPLPLCLVHPPHHPPYLAQLPCSPIDQELPSPY